MVKKIIIYNHLTSRDAKLETYRVVMMPKAGVNGSAKVVEVRASSVAEAFDKADRKDDLYEAIRLDHARDIDARLKRLRQRRGDSKDEGWFLSRESAKALGQELSKSGKSDRAVRAWIKARGYTNLAANYIMEGFKQAKEGTA